MARLLVLRIKKLKRRLTKPALLMICAAISAGCAIYERFHPSFLSSFSRYGQSCILPVKAYLGQIVITVKNLNKHDDYEAENVKLKEENLALKMEMQRVLSIVSMQQLFSIYKDNLTATPNIGQVIGFESQMHQSNVIVSCKGFEAEIGQIGVTEQGLVGFVVNKRGNIALIQGITDSRTYVPAKTKSGVNLIVRGGERNCLLSTEIKSDDHQVVWTKIKVGDILYTSGEGGMFTQNIPLGKVSEIDRERGVVKAIPIVDFNTLSFVVVQAGAPIES